jgi:hypothetical protein
VRLVAEIITSIAGDIRETLPSTPEEAGIFVAGACWAFILFWSVLILVTWLYVRTVGGA